ATDVAVWHAEYAFEPHANGKDCQLVGLCSDGYEFPCCGRNYRFLTETGLPNEFHRLMMLAMIAPSLSCDAIFCVRRVAPMHRLMREICASTSARTPYPYFLWNA